MTPQEEEQATRAICKLMAARIRAMDLKQWDDYGPLHTPDAVSETYGDLPPDKQPKSADGKQNRVVGPQALTDAIRRFMEHPVPMTSVHHVHLPEITFTSDNSAQALWPMEDHLWWQNGDREEWLHGYGHYYEEYRLTDAGWRISFRRLTRLRLDKSPNFHDRT